MKRRMLKIRDRAAETQKEWCILSYFLFNRLVFRYNAVVLMINWITDMSKPILK
jgi:hypothetical protein